MFRKYQTLYHPAGCAVDLYLLVCREQWHLPVTQCLPRAYLHTHIHYVNNGTTAGLYFLKTGASLCSYHLKWSTGGMDVKEPLGNLRSTLTSEENLHEPRTRWHRRTDPIRSP